MDGRLLAVRAGVLVVLVATALPTIDEPGNPHHIDVARAFARGSVWIDEPTVSHDMGRWEGRWYSPFPPLPALVAVPMVVASANPELWLNLLTLAAALAAVWTAGRLGTRVGGTATGTWAMVALGLGSGLWMATLLHDTYHTPHVLALLACLLAVDAASRRRPRPLAAGLALGVAALARQAVALGAVPVAGLGAARFGRRLPAILAATVIGVCVPLTTYLVINLARFGSPLATGYGAIRHHPSLMADVQAFGVFSPAYVLRNLELVLAGMPRVVPVAPWLVPDPRGMALLLVSPWIAFAILPLIRPDRPGARRQTLWCWLAMILISVPHLLYVNSGWVQFGYRFALDEMPFLLLAAILGVRRASQRWAVAVLGLAVAVNIWGYVAFLTWDRWAPLIQ